jgi:hypothetical protein
MNGPTSAIYICLQNAQNERISETNTLVIARRTEFLFTSVIFHISKNTAIIINSTVTLDIVRLGC